MKKIFLSVLTILSLGVLVVSATDTATTTSTTNTTTKPKFERMGPPYQDCNSANRPAPPDGDCKGRPRPMKRPDAKPGGDKMPPEFMKNSNTSTSTSTNE